MRLMHILVKPCYYIYKYIYMYIHVFTHYCGWEIIPALWYIDQIVSLTGYQESFCKWISDYEPSNRYWYMQHKSKLTWVLYPYISLWEDFKQGLYTCMYGSEIWKRFLTYITLDIFVKQTKKTFTRKLISGFQNDNKIIPSEIQNVDAFLVCFKPDTKCPSPIYWQHSIWFKYGDFHDSIHWKFDSWWIWCGNFLDDVGSYRFD